MSCPSGLHQHDASAAPTVHRDLTGAVLEVAATEALLRGSSAPTPAAPLSSGFPPIPCLPPRPQPPLRLSWQPLCMAALLGPSVCRLCAFAVLSPLFLTSVGVQATARGVLPRNGWVSWLHGHKVTSRAPCYTASTPSLSQPLGSAWGLSRAPQATDKGGSGGLSAAERKRAPHPPW